MSNNRQDKYEKIAKKAIKAVQGVLFDSGISEVEGMIILKLIATNLNKAIELYVGTIGNDKTS